MYFDFDGEYRPDFSPVGRAISWREGVLLSIIVHLALIIVMLVAPKWFPFGPSARARQAVPDQPRPEDAPRFVFVQPRVDRPSARPPDRGEASDQNRQARAPERALKPENDLPFSRGNSPNRVERSENQVARGQGPGTEPTPPSGPQLGSPDQLQLPESMRGAPAAARPNQSPGALSRATTPGGRLGDALRNLGRLVEREQFNNPDGGGGGGSPDPNIQFDTKGVEFGPWLRRFVAQVRRNWEPLIPYAAISLKGHVVVTFNIHKNGLVSDITVVAPCPVDGFNNAAYGAMAASNPTYPLPPDYPSEQAFFTVTFFYNEQPPR